MQQKAWQHSLEVHSAAESKSLLQIMYAQSVTPINPGVHVVQNLDGCLLAPM